MFHLSTKGDYGLIVMYNLATQPHDVYLSLADIAREYNLSPKYLSRIIIPLKKAGLIESKEGMDGGYRLARPATGITMLEVIEVLEGSVSPVKCLAGKECPVGTCALQRSWNWIQQELTHVVADKTLADFVSMSQLTEPTHAHA